MNFNYKKALKRIKIEELKGNNPIPDILSFLHLKSLYRTKLYSILDELFEDYKSGCNKPASLLRIDVPKPNFTIRPMSRPEIKDWILFEAIVELIAMGIAQKIKSEHICERSFSFLNFLPETEEDSNWIKFDDRSRDLYTLGYKYVVVADLTGYYENISLTELKKRLNNYLDRNEENKEIIGVLGEMLSVWSTGRVSDYGLPQGPPASSFLADLYLDLVDRKMEPYENYFRWMDDIRIFCKTEIEAKKALKDLIISLRGIKLNINAKKTKIVSGKEIEKVLFDSLKPSLNFIDQVVKSGDISRINKTILTSLIGIFENSFLDDSFEKRHLIFSLYRLSIIYASGIELDTNKVVSLIKENFISKPHHAGLFCFFLTLFPKDETIAEFLISFLKSEHNIYEWQEVKILQCLLRFNIELNTSYIQFFIESAKDFNKHFTARAYYFLLVGKHGSNRDRELIVDLYSDSFDQYLKIAIILAVQELGQASRNEFYSQIRNEESDEIRQFINYVKSLKHPLYYLDREHPRLKYLEEGEPVSY